MKKLFPFLIATISLFFSFSLPAQESSQPTLRTVEKVINGGEIVLEGGEVVRLIGVQAPRKQDAKPGSAAFGWWRRSQEFTSGMVLGRKVWLEYGKVRKDEEGRTWAYVYFKLDSTQSLGGGGQTPLLTNGTYMLNRLVVRYGMATSGNPFSFRFRSQFKQMEQEARQNQTGLFQTGF
ncbi:MAG: thermonuclease family protein [bacterium]|nr:thermonuclease family protein [bacterium]